MLTAGAGLVGPKGHATFVTGAVDAHPNWFLDTICFLAFISQGDDPVGRQNVNLESSGQTGSTSSFEIRAQDRERSSRFGFVGRRLVYWLREGSCFAGSLLS